MKNLSIRTYKPGTALSETHFFILNKGLNAGQPSKNPWCNCWVVTGDDLEDYYWLCYSLWKTGRFRHLLKGSVVPFIRLRDAQKLIASYHHVLEHKDNLRKIREALDLIQRQQDVQIRTYNNLEDLKMHLLYRYQKGV